MTFESDAMRRAAPRFDELLDQVAALRRSPRWTGPAAERFDRELRGWLGMLHQFSEDLRSVAARLEREAQRADRPSPIG
ncbi:WXG100 family type VII secretion target [Microtetraspora glauca]|uniref:WXG100 family type VII secretion target n=1 Tax=Microtetraspora glauca TaxID=1996 RepID=A0ABV3GAU3_MICGL